jgi:hypothetical protein
VWNNWLKIVAEEWIEENAKKFYKSSPPNGEVKKLLIKEWISALWYEISVY